MNLPIEFDSRVLGNLADATGREWLETNGIGGFASSTLVNLNTRRYHGLLVAATHPPLGRSVLLSKLEPVLVLEGRRYELSVNQYAGAVHPEGHHFLKAFRLDPFPVLTYGVEDIGIEQTIFLVHGENTVVVQYQLLGELHGRNCSLEIRPLLAFRDYHDTTHANEVIRREVVLQAGMATVAPYPGMPRLHFAHNAESLDASGFWYYDFLYERERERGLDYREDLYSPFLLRYDLTQNTSAAVIASTLPHQAEEAFLLEEREIERRTEVLCSTPSADDFVKILTAAADQFIVARGEQKSVIAGYPWFGDWGRDTMISLPGLTLATGRYEDRPQYPARLRRSMSTAACCPTVFPRRARRPNTTRWTRRYGCFTPSMNSCATRTIIVCPRSPLPGPGRDHRLARAGDALRDPPGFRRPSPRR